MLDSAQQADRLESCSQRQLASLRYSAMGLLARREHSLAELKIKLLRRYGDDSDLIDQVLEQLGCDGLQSDERFCQAYIAMRSRGGRGPLRIAMELRERGIGDQLTAAYLDPQDDSWLDSARSVRHKRFGCVPPTDLKARAKQMRFLQYRGFSREQIDYAFRG